MNPFITVVHVNGRRRQQLFLPLFLFWLLLLPFLLLALPFLLLLLVVAPIRTWRGARSLISLLSAVRGTRVEMSAPHRSLFVHVC